MTEPLIVRRADERQELVPEIQRVLSAHVSVECLSASEDLDELEMVRGRRLAEQGERLDPGSLALALSLTNVSSTGRAWPTNWGSTSTGTRARPRGRLCPCAARGTAE
jgi:hypothetical protein